MRKLIYSFMLAVAACMMFTSCGDEPKTFSGTYTFVNVEADIHATATGVDQTTIDYYVNMLKREYLEEYNEIFKGATITVDDINGKATILYDGEKEECDFVQDNGKFTMSFDGETSGTISDTELIVTEDLTNEMSDTFDEDEAIIDRFVFTLTFVKK